MIWAVDMGLNGKWSYESCIEQARNELKCRL